MSEALGYRPSKKSIKRVVEKVHTSRLYRLASVPSRSRKPAKEETAGRKRLHLSERDLWGFEGRGRSAGIAARAGGA
jgi:hypothetical protein